MNEPNPLEQEIARLKAEKAAAEQKPTKKEKTA